MGGEWQSIWGGGRRGRGERLTPRARESASRIIMPRSFLESNFATRAEYEKNVLLPEAEQDAAEAAEAERQKAVSGSQALPAAPKRPTAIIVIGMAGSGKTTLMQRINVELHASQTPYYVSAPHKSVHERRVPIEATYMASYSAAPRERLSLSHRNHSAVFFVCARRWSTSTLRCSTRPLVPA